MVNTATQKNTSACQHEHTHSINTEQKIAAVINTCQQQGLRFTPLRRQVLELIVTAHKPIGAYELLAQLQAVSDKPVAPPTVYRSLDFLLEHGFIHQLSSTKAFFACCQPDGQHIAAFLICHCCGDVQEFSHPPIDRMLKEVATESQFLINTSVIELSGLCHACQN